MKYPNKSQRGFSLLETVVVIALMATVTAMAVLGMTNPFASYKADGAMDQVLSQLRAARLRAISQRHNVQVQFVGNNQITFTDILQNGTQGPNPVTITLEAGAKFALASNPNTLPDTPMQFGNASPVYFENQTGGPTIMEFSTTGALIDANNNFVDGTLFLAIDGKTNSARAVTVIGATGRVRAYHWSGSHGWQE
jgi:prepilin-type N-terminal cleavage/methylation domain-containing protein